MPSSTDSLLPEILTLQPAIPNSVSASLQLKTSEGTEQGDQAEQDTSEEGVRGGTEELAQDSGVSPLRVGERCRDMLLLGQVEREKRVVGVQGFPWLGRATQPTGTYCWQCHRGSPLGMSIIPFIVVSTHWGFLL